MEEYQCSKSVVPDAAVKQKTSPAHENAKLSTIAIQYWIIHYPSAYQYQITQFYKKQSPTDLEGKPYIKMSKIKHAASNGTFQPERAASGK